MTTPIELEYIYPVFKKIKPRAVPVVGQKGRFRLLHDKSVYDLGLVMDYDVQRLKVRGLYKLYKLLEKNKQITFCSKCGKIIGCKPLDGFNRPWENICAECFINYDK